MIQKVQRHEETQQAKVRRKMGIIHGRKGEGEIDVRKTRKNEIENRDFTAEEVSERVLIFHKDEHLLSSHSVAEITIMLYSQGNFSAKLNISTTYIHNAM